MRSLFLAAILLTAPAVVCAQPDSLVSPGATLTKVSGQFSFTEGPATDKKGNIYFTDQPNNKIWKYDTNGRLSVFLDNAGRSNGLYIDKKGNILACADEKNELWQISPSGKVTVLVRDLDGKKMNGPNDLWIDKKGGIYFTDPYYQRDYWQRKTPDIKAQNVYYLPAKATRPVAVAEDLAQPNGIVGSPDGKYLYVADIRANKTYRYVVGRDGMLTEKTMVFAQGSDGMTLDERGNIYVTGRGVTIYDPAGNKLKNIPVPARWTANVGFGGKDRKTLFITASESVYTLRMNVKGVE